MGKRECIMASLFFLLLSLKRDNHVCLFHGDKPDIRRAVSG
jgi:hypothetical protein